MKRGVDAAKEVREYFFRTGSPNSQENPSSPKKNRASKKGLGVMRQYLEQTLEDGLPNLEAWQATRKSPHYDENVERLLESANYFLSYSNCQLPLRSQRENDLFQIPTEILYYLQLVRESYQGRITHPEILEELAHGFQNARRSPRFRARTEAERSADPSKGFIEDIPGKPITLEQIAETVQKDLGTSLIHDYLVEADDFNADVYAYQRGFSSGSKLYNSLRPDQKDQFKETMRKVYEAKTRAGEKVNVSEFCRKAGISTSTFYRHIREKEGSMEEFKEKLRKETLEEKEPVYSVRPISPKIRKWAKAAVIGLALLLPSNTSKNTDAGSNKYIQAQKQSEQLPQQNIEFASL